MTDHEDRFAASLDALSRGEPPAADDDLARFVAETRSTWSNSIDVPPGSPPRLSAADRRHLWTAIQQEAAVNSSATSEGSHFMSATSPNVLATSPPRTGWGATIARWQPVLSMAVMFAILAGLVGIAYIGFDRHNGESEPNMLAALQDDATPAPTLTCVDYGPSVRSSSELRDMSISDWPPREYTPVVVADQTIGQRAVEVYENWLNCAWAMSDDSSESVPPSEIQRFWSDRGQYIFMLERNPAFRPGELSSIREEPLIHTMLLEGVLPLNRPLVEVEDRATGYRMPTFAPGDVFLLSDGRYAVVMGTVTTAQLVGLLPGNEARNEIVSLTFVAFVEENGHLLIDQYLGFCLSTPILPFYGSADIDTCLEQ